MLSYANPSVKGILHIADMIQGTMFVCVLIHTGMSHSSVSTTAQRLKKWRRDQKLTLVRDIKLQSDIYIYTHTQAKEMCVKRLNKLDKKAFNHRCRRAHRQGRLWWFTGVKEVCELLIVSWWRLQAPVCTDIDILYKAELCGVLGRRSVIVLLQAIDIVLQNGEGWLSAYLAVIIFYAQQQKKEIMPILSIKNTTNKSSSI